MKFIIVRHGRTEENENNIIQGHLHGKLSETGKAQAKKVAERLKEEDIDFIFSSDLDRAKHTAEEIAKFHPGISLNTREDLRERNWGFFEGKDRNELSKWKHIKNNDVEIKKLGLETNEEQRERAKKVIDYFLENYHSKKIVIVSHGRFMKDLIGVLAKKK
jgi:broad specificity phosphatase PhoE